jgi:UDP:flavonoid glycosyltransferase YjiC (YdhE family)
LTKRRILLFAEAVTLAHVVRLVSIGRSLDPERHEVHLATDPRYAGVVGDLPFPVHRVGSMPAAVFQRALSTGAPIFEERTLRGYVEEERTLLASLRPDTVIGDFRISLAISARLAGIPFVNLTNAYWSPYATIRHVLPEITLARVLGPRIGQPLFMLFRPLGYAGHVRPVNKVRRAYGLAPLPSDFRHALADGDFTCYADLPEVVPTRPLPATHRFVGPIPWSPDVPLPNWWGEMEAKRAAGDGPVLYVTLGSSGPREALGRLLRALEGLPVTVIASTAGHADAVPRTRNAYLAPLLPGDKAVAVSSAVICNGGSPTSYQGLSAGKPVIGVATNMDQFLNMGAIEDAGCGMLLRSGRLDDATVRNAVTRVLEDSGMQARARELAVRISAVDWRGAMADVLARVRST